MGSSSHNFCLRVVHVPTDSGALGDTPASGVGHRPGKKGYCTGCCFRHPTVSGPQGSALAGPQGSGREVAET